MSMNIASFENQKPSGFLLVIIFTSRDLPIQSAVQFRGEGQLLKFSLTLKPPAMKRGVGPYRN